MIKNYLKCIVFISCLATSVLSNAQSILYSENFNSVSPPNLPSLFVGTGDWITDPNSNNGGGVPECNVAGSSSLTVLAGAASGASENVIIGPLDASAFTSLKVSWNGYRTTGAPTLSVSFSTNGSTFTNVSFTDVATDDAWHALATKVALPAGANAASTLYIKLAYDLSTGTSGSFIAFDDFVVEGSQSPTFYWNGLGSLDNINSWGKNTNGSGVKPVDFVTDNQVFNIVNGTSATLSSAWSVSGNNVKVNVGDVNTGTLSVNFTVPSASAFTIGGTNASLVVCNNATLTLQNTTVPTASVSTFNTGSTIVYAQSSNVNVISVPHHNLTLSNSNKTQSGNLVVNGVLNLSSVNLIAPSSALLSLTLNGTVSGSGAVQTTSLSNISIGGTGALGTITFSSAVLPIICRNLTLNRTSSGSITLGSSLQVNNQYSQTNGTLNLNGKALTLASAAVFPAAASNGVISGSTTSSLTVNGSGTITNNLFMDQTSSATRSMFDVIMNRTGQTLTIGNALDIYGSITPTVGTIASGGNVTLKSTASLKGRVGQIGSSGSLTGNVTVEMLALSGTTGWTNLGNGGVQGQTVGNWNSNFAITCPSGCPDGANVSGTPFTSLYTYNEAQGALAFDDASRYIVTTGTSQSIPTSVGFWAYFGNGYPSTGNITITLAGNVNQKALSSVPLTLTGGASSDHGWNLIANPYPSPISFTSVRNGNASIDNTVYVWNPDLNGGNGDFATFTPPATSSGMTDNIPTGQGFYVHVSAATSITPAETWKSATAATSPLLKVSSYNAPAIFKLNLTGGGSKNFDTPTLFNFDNSATAGFDPETDVYQMPPQDQTVAQMYSILNGEKYRLNSLPVSGTVSMDIMVRSGFSGNYTITPFDMNNLPSGACVNLYDKFTGTTHDLRSGAYSFVYSDTTTVPRFSLNITLNNSTLTSSITKPTCSQSQNGLLTAKGTTAGPWNYTWKDANNTVIRSVTKSVADTLNSINAGDYSVDINTVGSCDNANKEFSVVAQIIPTADFTADTYTLYLASDSTINLSNASTNTDTYLWHFGDGGFATGNNVSYTYETPGNYIIELEATNTQCNETVTSTREVVVMDGAGPLGVQTIAHSDNLLINQDAYGAYVQFDFTALTHVVISAYDVLGQQVMKPMSAEGTKDKLYLNIYPKNQIIIITVTSDQKRYSKKIFNN